MKWSLIARSFLGLLYPKLCEACGTTLNTHEEVLCLRCLNLLPRTNFWNEPDNPVDRIFWGRVQIEHACALFPFVKGSRYRKLIHSLKYHGKREIGIMLGRLLGQELKNSPFYQTIDTIVPVPLHPKKQYMRGYNQCEQIAIGIARATGWAINTTALSRQIFTNTQTRRISQINRWVNVSEVFHLNDPDVLKNKHILLVDDVLTSGSTLDACATQLQKIEGCKISIAVLSYIKRH
ncbi:MAG: ComF family protein [Prevotellaceae bacterium]|jgi:ComF family protein|nr:ComF family protein [Prevotellaceae bacterium]